jgi:hypothetical protein
MYRLTVIVIHHYGDDPVEKCVRSVKDIADEIILLDPHQYPKSKELTGSHAIKLVRGNNAGFIDLIREAVRQATFESFFFIGSNEYISESLRASIREIKVEWEKDGYSVSRFKNYYGKWMRHSGLYPDQPVRLYKKNAGYWTGEAPEEHIELKKPESVTLLKGDLYCTVFKNIQEHIGYINHATQIEANKSFKKDEKVSTIQIIFLPFKYFLRQYFIKLGILDGFYGLVLSVLKGFSSFLELIKLRDLIRSEKR